MSIRAARFARSLALLGASSAVGSFGCGSASPQVVAVPPPASTSNNASSNVSPTTTSTAITTDTPTSGDGACRCSWDTNAAAAPRVCKRGENNYEQTVCTPAQGYGGGYGGYRNRRYYPPPPMPGPLPPPDLAFA